MTAAEVPAALVEKAAQAMRLRPNGMEFLLPMYRDLARASLAAVLPEIQAQALREAADEMEAEYEERTAKSGAYGQTKIRAALLMGAGMIRSRAARLTTTTEEPTDV